MSLYLYSNCIDMHLYCNFRQNSFQTENARKITQKMQIYQGMFLQFNLPLFLLKNGQMDAQKYREMTNNLNNAAV